MEVQNSYIKFKVDNIEIEVQGTEDFIEKQELLFKEIFSSVPFSQNPISSIKPDKISSSSKTTDTKPEKLTIQDVFKQDFHYWRKAISKDTDDAVSYVIAGYFIQKNSKENFFTTQEVFSLLYKHGILLQDATKCETHNIENKNIIKVGTSKKWSKLRVNEEVTNLLHDILLDSI